MALSPTCSHSTQLFPRSWHVYFPLEFEFRGKSCVEWEHVGENGISCFLPCILLLYIEWIWINYCKLSRNFVGAIRTTTINGRVSFIDLYLVFPRNFRIVFLPHTNTVILLEPYCGTITEPGLPVLKPGVEGEIVGLSIFWKKVERVGIKTTFFVCLKSIAVNKYYV